VTLIGTEEHKEASANAIPFDQKILAQELYAKGHTTNQVVEETGISKGSVISIIQDAKAGRFPVPDLRERLQEAHALAVRLKKERLDLSEARLGTLFFKVLQELGVEPERLEDWVKFSSQVGNELPVGFAPAAMEFFKVLQSGGSSYDGLVGEVKELAAQRDRLVAEVGDLRAQEEKARQLGMEVDKSEGEAKALSARLGELQQVVGSLVGLLERRAAALGIPVAELEAQLKELISVEDQIAQARAQRDRLKGEVAALEERQRVGAAQMFRAAADFERDLGLLMATRGELAETAELKGRLEEQLERVQWALQLMPFVSDPAKVADEDFALIAMVVECVDRWVAVQPDFRYRSDPRLSLLKEYVHGKRMQLRAAPGKGGQVERRDEAAPPRLR
ncbi:MAG: hypothetical protein Q8O76_06600, partial [Chloroflexota bacterium]|nr:hypothetical protein [Chloroflexota bacterium]